MAINVPIISTFDKKGITQASNSFKSLKNVGGKALSGLASMTKIAAGATAGLAAGLGVALNAAVEDQKSQVLLADALKKNAKATDDAIKANEDYLATLSATVAVADDDLRPAMSNLARATGSVEDSQKGLEIALDISAATGQSLESVSKGLSKAYSGNTGALKKLSPQLGNLIDKGASMSEINDVLTDQFGGSAAKAAGTYEGQLKNAKIQLGEIVEQIGGFLLPIFGKMVDFLNTKVIPNIKKVVDIFKEKGLSGVIKLVGDKIKKDGPKLWDAFKNLASKAWGAFTDWMGKNFGPMMSKLGDFIGKIANWLIDEGLPKLVDNLQKWGQAFIDWIEPQIQPALKKLGELIGKIAQWILTKGLPKLAELSFKMLKALGGWVIQIAPEVLAGLAQAFWEIVQKLPGIAVDLLAKMGNLGIDITKSIFNGIVDGIKNTPEFAADLGKALINGVIDLINTQLIDRLNNLLEIKIDPPGPGSINFNPPDISHIKPLAKGGIVTAPTLALIGEAGPEAVVPLNRFGASSAGTSVTINVHGGDPQAVVDALRKYMRTNGAIPIRTTAVA